MTLAILALFGVLSIFLFALRGFLDQLPDVFASAGRARDAWRAFKQARSEVQSVPLPAQQDQDPPVAA